MSDVVDFKLENVMTLVFMSLVIVSIIHSIVLMRVCLHVIDRVFRSPREHDQ